MKAKIDVSDLGVRQQTSLCGPQNENLKRIAYNTNTVVTVANNHILVEGTPGAVAQAKTKLQEIIEKKPFGATSAKRQKRTNIHTFEPKNERQQAFVEAFYSSDILFGIGPAGTGKTFLSVAMALKAIADSYVERIVLVRPAREAGEQLGYLPGSLTEKVEPYQRAVTDCLDELQGRQATKAAIEDGTIQIEAIGYMRGRSLKNTCLVIDEAQNLTVGQMKMMLTRIEAGSKLLITGDPHQCDLPPKEPSGLAHALHVLRDVKGIETIKFESIHVMRHPLIQHIVEAYDKQEKKESERKKEQEEERRKRQT